MSQFPSATTTASGFSRSSSRRISSFRARPLSVVIEPAAIPVAPLSRSASVRRNVSSPSPRFLDTTIGTPSAKHFRDGCECRTIRAPRTAINQVLAQGEVPILRIEMTDTNKLGFRAKRADGRTKYVVVLHALPEMLGSSNYNTITTCQLMRIADRMGKLQVEEVRAELCLWADFLCAPTGMSSRQVPRINEIYRNAYAVLMFDPRLRNNSGSIVELQAYLASLMEFHQKLALNDRILLVTNQGSIDMRARDRQQSGGRSAVRIAQDYFPV